MKSSMNSSSFSASPIMLEEEPNLPTRTTEEQKTGKEIMGVDVVDEGKGEHKMIEAGKSDKEMGAVWADATIIRVDYQLQAPTRTTKEDEQLIFLLNESHLNQPVFSNAGRGNENYFISIERRTQTLDQVMEALIDPINHILGIHSSDENAITTILLEKVARRAKRDNIFDVILMTNVTNKPNIKKIQDEIAGGLNLKLDEKSTAKRANFLHDSIKMKQKILVILNDLYKGIDLGKVGIPYGADHDGCKILLTSVSEDVLSNQMHTQKNFIF